jgi:hypothetical protein
VATIDGATIETLAANFAGELIQPQEPGFDATRQIWNGHVQRWPALIARCRGVADVMAAVRFCQEHDLLASVRGGGHAVAGHAICDGGVVIDLSAMTGSRVDPLARTIQLEGGLRCSRSARPCPPGWWRGRWTTHPRCSGSSGSSSPTHPTRSAASRSGIRPSPG